LEAVQMAAEAVTEVLPKVLLGESSAVEGWEEAGSAAGKEAAEETEEAGLVAAETGRASAVW
jgi:hypothetical protein